METENEHLPLSWAEATVTLDDVIYIYGLPIDGPAIAGRVWSHWMILEEKYFDRLGVAPNPLNSKGDKET